MILIDAGLQSWAPPSKKHRDIFYNQLDTEIHRQTWGKFKSTLQVREMYPSSEKGALYRSVTHWDE